MKKITPLLLLFISYYNSFAQGSYPPDASSIGTTAIHKDSSIFVSWAATCQINRGWQNSLNTSLGRASSGTSSNAIGKSGINGTVSLGDNGEAILSFEHPIINGIGFDFAVFENAFNHTFLELAFVEVSTNGTDFVRFPSYSQTQTVNQVGGFEELDPTNIHNLAGKYMVGYGTPFDLEDLVDSTLVDINNINYIKIIDVIGIVNNPLASLDNNSTPINDPYPTPYATSGFDLDAIGIIHQFVSIQQNEELVTTIYPNPSSGMFTIKYNNSDLKNIALINSLGEIVINETTTTKSYYFNQNISSGTYILQTKIKEKTMFNKIIIQ